VLLLGLASTITNLPWSFYSTFVLEEKHGFNKQTRGVFFTDTIKRLLLGAVLIPPIVAGFTYILQHAGPWVPLHLWGFVLSVSLVMLTIYPVLIAPLFNKFESLPDGSLRSKVEALAGSLKFPLTVSAREAAGD
jgi:STE24 endopeptidase